MRPELIVAEKEFRDHITSKRFIIIFGIMMLLAIYAIYSGMDAYNKALDEYKNPQSSPNNIYQQQYMTYLEQRIQDAQANNAPAEEVQMWQDQLDALRYLQMPSILNVFTSMLVLFTLVGILLGTAMGFDQIAREKDEGSLKLLASSPIYRDAIINGKTIGALATLAAAMGASFIIAIAIVMLRGVVPGLDDLIRIFLFFLAAMLYCTVFYALAMMVSALSKNTAIAAIFTVGMVFAVFIYTIMAMFASSMIATAIVGPAPYTIYTSPVYTNVSDESGSSYTQGTLYTDDANASYNYYTNLSKVQSDISGVLSSLSPIDDFSGFPSYGHMGVGQAMITRPFAGMSGVYSGIYKNDAEEISLLDSLGSVWMRILIMIAEIVAAFGIAYVAFMRTDIR